MTEKELRSVERLQSQELRRYVVLLESADQVLSGKASDISKKGLLFTSLARKHTLATGEALCTLFFSSEKMTIRSRIAWVERRTEDGRETTAAGIEFIDEIDLPEVILSAVRKERHPA
jgi:hypothetical protein